MQNIADWAADCDAKGLKVGFVMDSGRALGDVLRDVLAAGLGSFGLRNGLYSVVRDVEQTVPVQMFTPANSWDFSYSRTFVEPPHALRVKFTNPEANDQEDTRLVYWDGYNEDGSGGNTKATIFEELDARQTIDPDAAWHLGRYHLAVMHLRPTTYSWMADIENLVCERGDLVHTSYDLIGWGKAWGRVKAIDGATVTLDGPVELDPNKTYAFRIRKDDNTQITQTISSWSSDSHATSADATKFARGNGSDDKFQLYDANGRAVTKDATITAIHQTDWQGRVELSDQPRTNLLRNSGDISALYWSGKGSAVAQSPEMSPWGTPCVRMSRDAGTPDPNGYVSRYAHADASIGDEIFVMAGVRTDGERYMKLNGWSLGLVGVSFDLVNGEYQINGSYSAAGIEINGEFALVWATFVMPSNSNYAYYIGLIDDMGLDAYTGAGHLDVFACMTALAGERGVYIPTTTAPATVTDYTASDDGQITLGQKLADGGTLDWTGEGDIVDPVDTITLAGEIPDMEPGDLFLIGEVNHGVAPLIITKIEPDNDLTAKITAVDANPGVWSADSGTPPTFVSSISGKAWCAPPKPPVVHIYASNSTPNHAGVIDSQVNVNNSSPASGIYRFTRIGNGYGCPDVDALVRMADGTDKRAGDIKVGDMLTTADPVTLQPGIATVRYSETKAMSCVEVETRNRSLVCSASAPLPTRRDGLKTAPNVAGKEVATLEGWHEVTVLRSAGMRQVQHIDINDGCFWCNGILHHNKRATLSPDYIDNYSDRVKVVA